MSSKLLSKTTTTTADDEGGDDVFNLTLPEEVWDEILKIVRANDNYTQDATAACRLVCSNWRDLIDKFRRTNNTNNKPGKSHHPPQPWNPYFETPGGDEDAEAEAVLKETKGIYLATVQMLETLLADWEDPALQPLLSKTLILDFRTAEHFRRLCERFPGVVETSLGSHIEHFKVAVVPWIAASREVILTIPKLTNLSSLTVHLREHFFDHRPIYAGLDPLSEWLSRALAATPQRDNSSSHRLVELNLLGDSERYNGSFHTLISRVAGGGGQVRNVQFQYLARVGPPPDMNLVTLPKLYQNVDTAKVVSSCWRKPWDVGVYAPPLEQLIPPTGQQWNIRRLSLKLLDFPITRELVCEIFSILHRRNATLEEFHLLFSSQDARLRGWSIYQWFSMNVFGPLRKLSFNLTTLSLPFLMMTERADLVKGILSACPKLIYLKLVVTDTDTDDDGVLEEASEPMKRIEVNAVVQNVWTFAPPSSVKWVFVKFRKALRDSKQRRYMTNIMWRYERPSSWSN